MGNRETKAAVAQLAESFIEEHGKNSTAVAAAIASYLKRKDPNFEKWIRKWDALFAIEEIEFEADSCPHCLLPVRVDNYGQTTVIHSGTACPKFKNSGSETRRMDASGWKNWEEGREIPTHALLELK